MSVLQGPVIEGRCARLVIDVPGAVGDAPLDGVVLVLHGGRSKGNGRTGRTQLAVLRMVPFANEVRRAAADAGARIVVARLQYRVRGWNGRRRDPVTDAEWALAALRERFGDLPVGLIGHSLGGRTAMAVAGAAGVVSVVGLAPWLSPEDPVVDVSGRRFLIMHGTADRMTDPAGSRAWGERARERAAAVTYVAVPGAKHAMLDQPRFWHRLAAGFTVATLGVGSRAAGGPRQDVPRPGTERSDVANLLPEALAGVPYAVAGNT